MGFKNQIILPFNVFNVVSHPKKYSPNPEKITGNAPINNKFVLMVLYFKFFRYGCIKIKLNSAKKLVLLEKELE